MFFFAVELSEQSLWLILRAKSVEGNHASTIKADWVCLAFTTEGS